jgi:diguanylate cyclase (GGDEF)-like protein
VHLSTQILAGAVPRHADRNELHGEGIHVLPDGSEEAGRLVLGGNLGSVHTIMRQVPGTLESSEEFADGRDECGGLSKIDPRANAAVLSIDRAKGPSRKSLESHLAAALRSEDSELHQILSALEEISNGLKSGALNERSLDNALQRAASCAMRQSLLDREIRCLAVTDDLTGIYNRRGFLASATHHLKLAHRNSQDALLLYCDVDNLKGINDTFGHEAGDLALTRAAEALTATFRDSDILARLGGDEFAVLASDASIASRQVIVPRIEQSLEKANIRESRFKLSFSIGMARFDPRAASTLGELMAHADWDMYLHKRQHRRADSASSA